MKLKNVLLAALPVVMNLVSCSNDDPKGQIAVTHYDTPTTYAFSRKDASSSDVSTVSYDDQKTRILMLTDITGYIGKGTTQSIDFSVLNGMFTNTSAQFTNSALAGVDSSIKLSDKTASSMDLFGGGNSESIAVQKVFTDAFQVADDASKASAPASAGVAGIYTAPVSGSKRLFAANGLEPSQIVGKGMMGAHLMDQVLNNFLSVKVLDANNNRVDNANKVVVAGKNYTEMEHAWDQAYGYIYGGGLNASNKKYFWDSYIDQVAGQAPAFTSLSTDIMNAFIKGRAAITGNDYAERDRQIVIIKTSLSKIPAIRGVHYLYEGQKNGTTGMDNFHGLSEGYGFIMSLRYTNNPATNQPYFTKAEVDAMLSDLNTGSNDLPGLYDIDNIQDKIDAIATKIAGRFGFSVADAKLGV